MENMHVSKNQIYFIPKAIFWPIQLVAIDVEQLSSLFQTIQHQQLFDIVLCHWFQASVHPISEFLHWCSPLFQEIPRDFSISSWFSSVFQIYYIIIYPWRVYIYIYIFALAFISFFLQFLSDILLRFFFFYNWLFREMVVQDDQSIKKLIHICWSVVPR